MNDTDEQDVRHRLTPEGGQKWLDRIEHDALVSGWPSRSAWCKDVDIALSTIGGQPDSSRLPMIDILFKVSETLGYSVAEQVADLCGRRLEQIAPPDPFDVAHVSMLDLHDRLDSALGSVGNRRPTITDITRSVLNSSHGDHSLPDGASPYGRWRARLFDVPMGWLFPHVGYHGVEFMRWYGPGRGRESDTYPAAAWWENPPRKYSRERIRGYVPKIWSLNKVPEQFAGNQSEWKSFRLERLELLARMQSLYPRADLSPYGGYGRSFRALLRHSDGSSLRHIFTQQASWSRPEPARGQRCIDDDIRLVVIAGPSSVRPVPVASLIGEALGWESVGFRTIQATLTGVRPINSQSDDVLDGGRDNTWRRARMLAQKRDHVMLIHANVNYLLQEINGDLELTAPARELLDDPSVLIVFLRPADGSGSAATWEARSRGNTLSGNVSSSQTAAWAQRAAEVMKDAARPRARLMTIEIQPTYIHWGDAYITPEEELEYLWHPTVGDLDVRVAAEVAHVLAHGREVGQVSPQQLRDNLRALDEKSTVGRYADQIFAATSRRGRHAVPWNRAQEAAGWTATSIWDDRFAMPPRKDDKAVVHQFGSAVTRLVSSASPWLTEPS
ncbi:hypothetical protein [Herbiconiux sp. UC225_62]|uniref:hypothetical protein n=1 Tax=Herbiconiux sp. UC225_62 TaxID=3350168 RepID=UPI0036D384B4